MATEAPRSRCVFEPTLGAHPLIISRAVSNEALAEVVLRGASSRRTAARRAAPKPIHVFVPEAVHQIPSYGPLDIGTIRCENANAFEAIVYGTRLRATYACVASAQRAAVAYWLEHFSQRAIETRFHAQTIGQISVRFLYSNAHTIYARKGLEGGILWFDRDGRYKGRTCAERLDLVPRPCPS